jgi:hypothetical protein
VGGPVSEILHVSGPCSPAAAADTNDERFCCDGAALFGPNRCTCWVPVYDVEQAEPQPGAMRQRRKCCHDCAFRNGSPERAEDPDHLDDVVARGRFDCHVGMRRIVGWRHPDGTYWASTSDDYDPPRRGDMTFKADGTAAEICAGWAAHRRG